MAQQGKIKVCDQELLQRIVCDPAILGGKPVVRGTRLSVDYLLGLLAHGASYDEILGEYRGLEEADIHASLLFASRSLSSASFMPLAAGPN